jgi:phosphoglycerate dehydrogenase-like enzyme
MDHYMNDRHREMVRLAAERCGFSAEFFGSVEAALPFAEQFEVFFGCNCQGVIKAAKNLRWFACAYAGIDPYVEDGAWGNPACLLSNSAGAYGVTIAEHVVMVLLMLLRRMPEYERMCAEREWRRLSPIRSVQGLRTTVVGTGNVGTETAKRLRALGASVRGVRRDKSKGGHPAFEGVFAMEEIDSLLPETDALILCLPGTRETRRAVDRTRLALLPQGSYLVNMGRGPAVDPEALLEALQSGHLAGAALDVTDPEPPTEDSPLWTQPNLILTPHCAGDMALQYTCDRVVEMFVEDLPRYAAGESLLHGVDRRREY